MVSHPGVPVACFTSGSSRCGSESTSDNIFRVSLATGKILAKTKDITKWVGTLEKPHRTGHTFVLHLFVAKRN